MEWCRRSNKSTKRTLSYLIENSMSSLLKWWFGFKEVKWLKKSQHVEIWLPLLGFLKTNSLSFSFSFSFSFSLSPPSRPSSPSLREEWRVALHPSARGRRHRRPLSPREQPWPPRVTRGPGGTLGGGGPRRGSPAQGPQVLLHEPVWQVPRQGPQAHQVRAPAAQDHHRHRAGTLWAGGRMEASHAVFVRVLQVAVCLWDEALLFAITYWLPSLSLSLSLSLS